MAISAVQVTIPSNGSSITVLAQGVTNSNQVSVRNTGSVTVLLGGSGTNLFPLYVNEFLGVQVMSDDAITAQVQSAGTAGQLTVLTG